MDQGSFTRQRNYESSSSDYPEILVQNTNNQLVLWQKEGRNSPAPQQYWAMAFIHVQEVGVFTLLTTMPYGAEVLNHCLAVTNTIPRCFPPAHGLLPAILVATYQVGFLGRAGWHLLWGFFFCALATLTLLCTRSGGLCHCADETERIVLLGNNRPAGISGKCHVFSMQSGRPS